MNIGVTEALAIYNRRDQIVLADVVARECRVLSTSERTQCERDITTQSAEIARRVREDADASVAGLRRLLRELATVEGHKSLMLLTEGLAVDDQNELASMAALAGAARTSINVLVLDLRRGDMTISEQPPTEQADRRLQMTGLEGLATMSLGSLFYIAGTGEPIFERLSSEISAYYLLGVEERPSDSEGDRHRVDVEVRRRGVTIRSRQAFVLSSARAGAQVGAGDRLRDTLTSPFPVSGAAAACDHVRAPGSGQRQGAPDHRRAGRPAWRGQGRLHAGLHPDLRRQPDRRPVLAATRHAGAARLEPQRAAGLRGVRRRGSRHLHACGWPPWTTRAGGGASCAKCRRGRCRARRWRSAIWSSAAPPPGRSCGRRSNRT